MDFISALNKTQNFGINVCLCGGDHDVYAFQGKTKDCLQNNMELMQKQYKELQEVNASRCFQRDLIWIQAYC